ncbi:MAG TPA: hypothetical protein VHF22_11130, partial [Planctomycetota bacterium]|nr:hypothetical protein [Planctomycetota bacterium]
MRQEMTTQLEKLQGQQFDRMVAHYLQMCNRAATAFVTDATGGIDPQVRPVLDQLLVNLRNEKTQIDQVCQSLGKGEGASSPGRSSEYQNQNRK